MKNKEIKSTETAEQKNERWSKNLKNARSFAKQAGIDKKAVAERKKIQREKRKYSGK